MMDWLTRRSRRKARPTVAASSTASATTGHHRRSSSTNGGNETAACTLADITHGNLTRRHRGAVKRSSGGKSSSASNGCCRHSSSSNGAAAMMGDDESPPCSAKNDAAAGTCRRHQMRSLCATLTDADFERLVRLPPCVDRREWVAVHTIAFFHHLNVVYGVLSEYCSVDTCSVMSGPSNVQIPWVDDKGKKCKYSAPQFIDCVMSIVEKIMHSEEYFPTKFGHEFPANFDPIMRRVFRMLFQVLLHVYACHLDALTSLHMAVQMLALCRHFGSFSTLYALLEAKDMEMLQEILDEWAALEALERSSDAYHRLRRQRLEAAANCDDAAALDVSESMAMTSPSSLLDELGPFSLGGCDSSATTAQANADVISRILGDDDG